jgi:hypothetical protein
MERHFVEKKKKKKEHDTGIGQTNINLMANGTRQMAHVSSQVASFTRSSSPAS